MGVTDAAVESVSGTASKTSSPPMPLILLREGISGVGAAGAAAELMVAELLTGELVAA